MLARVAARLAVFTGKPLYLMVRPADSFELLHHHAFKVLGEFLAVRDDRDKNYPFWWIITDYAGLKEFARTVREIPTAGPELVALWARQLGTEPDRWELSEGWAASAKRLAALMVDA